MLCSCASPVVGAQEEDMAVLSKLKSQTSEQTWAKQGRELTRRFRNRVLLLCLGRYCLFYLG